MKVPWKVIYLGSCLTLVAILLGGCPGGGASISRHLSGVMRDSATGAGVAGMTIDYMSRAATTAADGSFAIDLGALRGVVSGALLIHGVGHGVMYAYPISVDAGVDTQVTLFVDPTSTPPTHSVTITIEDSDGNEIPDGTYFGCFILNTAGGYTSTGNDPVQYGSGGCTINSPTFGTDCLVAALVLSQKDPYVALFNAMESKVDLSSSSTTVILRQDTAHDHTAVVSVAADSVGNNANLNFVSPYGVFTATVLSFPLSAAATVTLTNPYSYNGFWVQGTTIPNYLGSGRDKTLSSVSSPGPISTTVTLPKIVSSLGPNAVPAASSLACTGGTLSVAAAPGANEYLFMVSDSILGNVTIFSDSASVRLPSWLVTRLAGHLDSVFVSVGDSSLGRDLSTLATCTAGHGNEPGVALHQGIVSISGTVQF